MVGALAAFAVSAAACALVLWGGRAVGFVDRPDDELKTHDRPAVPLGGVGVLAGFVVAYWFFTDEAVWQIIAAAFGILALGLVDDARSLPPWFRLIGEAAVGGWVGLLAEPTGNVGVDLIIGVVVVVLCVNAVNLFDGLDALAASSGVMTLFGLAALAEVLDLSGVVALLGAAAMLGFLPFNLPPARLFLGDNGAYLTGLLISYGIMQMGAAGRLALLVGVALLGVFAVDLIATFLRRIAGGSQLFAGDREHLYDRLVASGVSVGRVSALAAQVQLAIAAVVVIATVFLGHIGGLSAGVVLAAVLLTTAWRANLLED